MLRKLGFTARGVFFCSFAVEGPEHSESILGVKGKGQV
jgi:hypothetical protein